MIRLTNDQGIMVLDLLDGPEARKLSDREAKLSDQIREQIDHPDHQKDLVETVAALMTSSRARIVLHGTLLQTLRDALLSPRELASLKTLVKTYQACGKCGKRIYDGEMMTMAEQGAYCNNCAPPLSYPCSHCKLSIVVPSGVSRVLTKRSKECNCRTSGAAPSSHLDLDEYLEPAGLVGVAALSPGVAERRIAEGPSVAQQAVNISLAMPRERFVVSAPTPPARDAAVGQTGRNELFWTGQTWTGTTALPPISTVSSRDSVAEMIAQLRGDRTPAASREESPEDDQV